MANLHSFSRRGLLLGGGVAMTTMALAACGESKSASSSSTSSGASDAKVSLTFWGWAPGYKEAVELWNKKNPNTQVTWIATEASRKIYPKMLTAVKANNAPDLAQVGYEALPSFVIQDAVQDIKEWAGDVDKNFTAAGAKSVNLGGAVYGIPVDTAPMAMIYNKALLDSLKIKAPKTWDEFASAARAVKKADPKASLTYFSSDPNFLAGLVRQAGGRWYDVTDSTVKVIMTQDAASRKVADFWQKLINEGSIPVHEGYTPQVYKQMNEDTLISELYGIWDTALIAQNVPKGKGKWAVAPLPEWPDRPGGADMGGSATVVLKGSKNAEAAARFATWMSTDPQAVSILISKGGLWPASTTGLANKALQKPDAFYSNDKVFVPFIDVAKNLKYDWVWGPTQVQAGQDMKNNLVKVSKSYPITKALADTQESTLAKLKKQGIKVG